MSGCDVMTDRELLGLAAKAFGIAIGFEGNLVYCVNCTDASWNPLTDDGDALRLAVKLKIDLSFEGEDVVFTDENWSEFLHGDPCAATRRAIVRAAAVIGESM